MPSTEDSETSPGITDNMKAPLPAPPLSSDNNNNVLNTVNNLLGSKLYVTMSDGRYVTGNFVSLDRLCNIILENAIEYRNVAYIPPSTIDSVVVKNGGGDDEDNNNKVEKMDVNGFPHVELSSSRNNNNIIHQWKTERELSQVAIPGHKLVKVEIAKGEYKMRVG